MSKGPSLGWRLRYEPGEWTSHVTFFIASAGYVSYDIMFGFFFLYCGTPYCAQWLGRPTAIWESNFLTVFWAVWYLVNSINYKHLSTFLHMRHLFNPRTNQFWSDMINLVCSILYLASQCLYYSPVYNATLMPPFFSIASAQAWLYFISLTGWAYNSVQYTQAYFDQRKADTAAGYQLDPVARDWEFWGNVLNLVASFGYMGTSLWSLIVIYPWANAASTQAATQFGWWNYFQLNYWNNQALQLVVNIVWDAMYTACASVYVVVWWRNGTWQWNENQKALAREDVDMPMKRKTDSTAALVGGRQSTDDL